MAIWSFRQSERSRNF